MQATIDQLERDVAAGKRRLRSPPPAQRMERPAPAAWACNRPRLTDSAQRDYFTLRERIATITGQVNYLQDYIRQQCLK
jgi:prophage endopeptidase